MEYPTSRQNDASLARLGKYRSKDRRRSRKWGDIRSRHGSSTSEDRNSPRFLSSGSAIVLVSATERAPPDRLRAASALALFNFAHWSRSAAVRLCCDKTSAGAANPPTTGRTRSPRGARLAHGLRVSKATTAAALGWQAGST
jgi:hypothetical protein